MATDIATVNTITSSTSKIKVGKNTSTPSSTDKAIKANSTQHMIATKNNRPSKSTTSSAIRSAILTKILQLMLTVLTKLIPHAVPSIILSVLAL